MKTILVIDDDAQLRSILSTFLQRRGWEVVETGDGDQGLELARKHLPQVILCDLLMPGTNGFRVCSAVRNDDSLRYSLLVAMSGKDFADTRQAALEAGADEFLVKPIDVEHFASLVDRMSASAPPRNGPSEAAAVDGPAFIRFWGVRGSIPVPGPDTVRYGGNTACVEFRSDGEIIILDSGTGIRPLGEALEAEFAGRGLNLTLLITHFHWDHIQGFPFFRPAYEPGNQLRVLGFEGTREGLAGIFSSQMASPYFPIGLGELPGHVAFEELRSMEFTVGAVKVQAAFANHPGVCVGYRLNTRAGSVAFLPDHEPFHRMRKPHTVPDELRDQARDFARSEDEKIVRFLDGVDALILDAQFDADEYARNTGWGHSSVDDAVDLAVRAKAKRLFLFHHDPTHTDDKMDQMVGYARKLAAKSGQGLEVEAAREGLKCELAAATKPPRT
jgi:phosphoribosyl 1,2-cyclic phosphodiesterase/ActR/RegA family two-component response regulator